MQPTKKRFNSRQLFLLSLVVFFGLAVVLSTVAYSTAFGWGRQSAESTPPATPQLDAEGNPIPTEDDRSGEETSGLPVVDVENPPEWDGVKRVTVLVMGVDYRDWESQEKYTRTDTMMLLTIDPVAKTAGALSIPRDLWAAIPGFNPAKINTAHFYGDLYDYPGGGPALAVKTVENVIGVPIDYYVRLDFNAFVDFIDLIEGVKVTVTEEIELEIIGKKVDTVLEPGRYTLNGQEALAYSRNRYNKGGDFDRARRQQQVIMGIRDRLLTPSIWSKLITNAPELYATYTKAITTNIPFQDMLELGYLATQIKEEDITMEVIGNQHVQYGTSPDNLSILIPLPDKIRELRDYIFATGGPFTPSLEGDWQSKLQAEQARIIIYDGTNDDTTAQRTADYLRGLGANVVSVQQADTTYGVTSLIDHTGSPYTLGYLAEWMTVGAYNIFIRTDMNNDADVEIWLGTQWQYSNPLP